MPMRIQSASKGHLFVLDKSLAGADGLDLCRFIKSNSDYKDIPVVMLSAAPDIKSLAAEAGADGTIEKPFTLKGLREAILHYTSA